MGLFEDLFNENTMLGINDFEMEYETPEAQALAESGYSDLPSMYAFAKAMKIPSTIGKTISKVGLYEAKINLHPEIQAKIHIEVVKEEGSI